MTDAPLTVNPSLSEPSVADSRESMIPPEPLPPNPLTLAPPASSLASGSPRPEGSPLKNVVLSAAEAMSSAVPTPDVPVQTPKVETAAESTTAQPSSPTTSDDPAAADHRDLAGPGPTAATSHHEPALSEPAPLKQESPWQAREEPDRTKDEALLPPPPDQVGNIDSPRSESGPTKSSDGEDKARDENGNRFEGEALPTQSFLNQCDSVIREDTIKPDDSASVRFPLSESGPSSEFGTASVGEAKDPSKESTVPLAAASSPPAPKQASPRESQAEDDEKSDLLGGLMGELDREAASSGAPAKPPSPQSSPGEAGDGQPSAGWSASEKGADIKEEPEMSVEPGEGPREDHDDEVKPPSDSPAVDVQSSAAAQSPPIMQQSPPSNA